MELEPITRKEKIIAGENLEPITRMEQFLKKFGGSGGSGGGSSVQPDWNQNDETAPDYVKNRPFYMVGTVETVLVEESTVTFSEDKGLYVAVFPSTFEATVGETYKVYWDGTAYECACVDFDGDTVIGNLSINGAEPDTGEPFFMLVQNGVKIVILTADTSASHTFSISAFVQEVVKIDEKYFPDTLAPKSDVEVVQTTATNAQAAADNAQETVNHVQNMVNSNKEALYSAFGSTVTFTFDKQTSGRDTFNFNAFNYYKISDFNPATEDVISFTGTNENGTNSSTITTGNNCAKYGGFIVVASSGGCSLPITETVTRSFTAPSAGLYAMYEEGNTYMTAGTGEFTLRGSTGSLSITGLLLKSSTAGSAKKFKITVDDTGALKATEVT